MIEMLNAPEQHDLEGGPTIERLVRALHPGIGSIGNGEKHMCRLPDADQNADALQGVVGEVSHVTRSPAVERALARVAKEGDLLLATQSPLGGDAEEHLGSDGVCTRPVADVRSHV